MPESSYSYKPVKEVWSFGELIHHIAYSLFWMNENYVKQQSSEWNPPPAKEKKKELIKYIDEGFKTLNESLKDLSTNNGKSLSGFITTMEHNAHHRGQATTYLRLKGIVPPEYPF